MSRFYVMTSNGERLQAQPSPGQALARRGTALWRRKVGDAAALIVVCVTLIAATLVHAAAPDAQSILESSDAIRNPDKPFSVMVTLIEYRDGKKTDGNALTVFSKADAGNGQYRSLIRYEEPARDTGKKMLKNGNDLWFYDPSSKASIRISPQQRLLGQASNGDVVTVNLAKDYRAKLEGEEDLQDGNQHDRHAYKLALAQISPDVTYDHVELWVDARTSEPIKGRFYSESNALLKTAYYRRYQSELGVVRPTETVIIDGLNPKWVTVMRYSDYSWRDVPDAWLQRDYLPQFNAH